MVTAFGAASLFWILNSGFWILLLRPYLRFRRELLIVAEIDRLPAALLAISNANTRLRL
jgi:hypothetical protein